MTNNVAMELNKANHRIVELEYALYLQSQHVKYLETCMPQEDAKSHDWYERCHRAYIAKVMDATTSEPTDDFPF